MELRYVLAGCGGISPAWFNALQRMPFVRCAGLVDIKKENAQKRAQEFKLGEVLIEANLSAVLKKVKPDVVFDCTLPESHVDICIQALDAGCHVLGEKPLADTMENAKKIVKKAAETKKLHAVMQNRRFSASIRTLRKFIESGVMGRLHTIYSDFFIGAHFGGFRDKMKHVLLLDMAIHTFDAARFITASDPLSVLAYEWNPPSSWYAHDSSACAIFNMTNDIVYGYRGSWCAEGLNTSWESHWRLIFEKGTILWDGGKNFKIQKVVGTEGFIRETKDLEMEPYGELEWEGHAGVIHNFIDCVMNGGVPETVGTDNIRSLAMVHSAIESAITGKKVEVKY